MNLDDQLRAALNEEAGRRTATPPDVPGLISGGQARRRRRNTARIGTGVLAVVIAGGGFYGFTQIGDDRTGSPGFIATTPIPGTLPTSDNPVTIGAGTYRVPAGDGQLASYEVTVPPGWTVQYGNSLVKNPDGVGEIVIDSFVLDSIRLTDDACAGPETLGDAQTSTTGLVAGLRAQGSGLRVGDPVAATVSGRPATRIDLDLPTDQARAGCRMAGGRLQVWRASTDDYFVLFPDERATVYVVDVAGREQLFVARFRSDVSAADSAEIRSILDSIRIDR